MRRSLDARVDSASLTNFRRTFVRSASSARAVVGSPRARRALRASSSNSLWRKASSARCSYLRHDARRTRRSRARGPTRSAASSPDAREWDVARVALHDRPPAPAGDVAGARVQEAGAPRPRARASSTRFCVPEGVGVERLVERRVEVDDAGDVHDRVDRPARARSTSAASSPQSGFARRRRRWTTIFSRKNASNPSPWVARSGCRPRSCAISPRSAPRSTGRRFERDEQVDAARSRGSGRAASTRRPCRETPSRRGRAGASRRGARRRDVERGVHGHASTPWPFTCAPLLPLAAHRRTAAGTVTSAIRIGACAGA